jgi:hypothetical protein
MAKKREKYKSDLQTLDRKLKNEQQKTKKLGMNSGWKFQLQ